jgi:predicted amidohydrolase
VASTQLAVPPDLFLSGYPAEIQDLAEQLRAVVREAAPEAIERVRTGWRIIGYDVPVGRKTRYFAFVAPEPKHVHLGWKPGIFMTDPDGILRGAHLDLKNVRYVTYEPGDEIPTETLVAYTSEAAALTAIGPGLLLQER